MSAFPISWHEDCLRNSKLYLEREREKLAAMQAQVEAIAKGIAFRESQIARAKELGKDSYDEERFMKPKSQISTSPL
jgi:hypothetical protein